MSIIYSGYCVLNDKGKILHQGATDEPLGLIKVVRDREYPDGILAKWVQGIGTPTITEVIK